MGRPLRVANCSGFYGDRLAAAREMVDGGPIDVLTGDWLAELTMLILSKDRARSENGGFAKTFVTQMEHVMGTCLDQGIKVVANAGGLNPRGCAAAINDVAERLGLHPTVAYVGGDDFLDRLDDLQADGHTLRNMDTGQAFGGRNALTANAYLGCWGIVEALNAGADIVITGRTTDASVVMGPAAWHFGWGRTDWDRLAGACVAGHVIECGCQATGGNYSFFQEVPELEYPGFPIADIYADGASEITKHPGTGGLVSVGTVTAQLLYEVIGPRYFNPDVVARFDTVRLEQCGSDRVAITGVRGEPAPSGIKLGINYVGGFRRTLAFPLTGLDVEEKAALVERTLWSTVPKESIDSVSTELRRTDRHDPERNELAIAELVVNLKDRDEKKIGRAVSDAVVQMALASYPGMFGGGMLTAKPATYGVYWPTLIPNELCASECVVNGLTTMVPNTTPGLPGDVVSGWVPALPSFDAGRTVREPLGRIVGARSGDKGGNANVGLWVRTPEQYVWLESFLTVDALAELLPEAREHAVERYELPNLFALNFVFRGLLQEGVAASTRRDPQAKGFGEYIRARVVDIPAVLLTGDAR
ncbi:acyclic terpene utilization AtuA family protein [Mycobacterium syngnathidarum]